ncbi:PaaI family thioesterase [Parabacteroides sp. OttesenSCG-928-G07]|nr:PaaI family thioesterase [Parabacteroides sp. OttesenSCG-928-G21]MDL2278572.1 PaaI family thioesterase [Parabacteroides sp. OttesenSCG-928-G07]
MKKIVNPWNGLEGYKCFGCAPENPLGLKLEFYEDGDDIVAIWKPIEWYQGWLDTLHGGILATLMDELGGWLVLRKLQTTGVTSRLDTRFLKSISTKNKQLTIRGRIKEQKRNAVFIESEISDENEEVCAKADMVYFVVTPEKAREQFHFCGCKTEEE